MTRARLLAAGALALGGLVGGGGLATAAHAHEVCAEAGVLVGSDPVVRLERQCAPSPVPSICRGATVGGDVAVVVEACTPLV